MNEEFVLGMDFNITKAQAKTNKLKREFEESKRKSVEIKDTIEELTGKLEAEKAKQVEIREVIQEQVKAAAELDRMIEKVESGNATTQEVVDLGNIDAAKAKLAEMEKEIQKNEQTLEKTYNSQKKTSAEIIKQNNLLTKQNGQTATIGEKISVSTKKTNKFSEAFKKSEKSAKDFLKRLKNIALSALLFSLVTKALTALREQFGKMITEQGTKTAELTAKLKGGLSVIGTTLYESAKPAIEWILNALVKMVNILANGLAKILGKDINEMKKLAKQTEKTGKEAKKTSGALAGFDQINTISKNNDSDSQSNSGIGTDFSALNSGIDSEVALLMAILSGAALILGVILAFTGVNIPLGIGLIAIGAIGLISTVAANWKSLDPKIQQTIAILTAIISTALIVIGAILAFTGVALPLGIALMALGAAGLVADAKLMWGSLTDKTQGVITAIMAIGGALLIVLGIALLFSGAGIPLGIGLIVVGAGLLYGAIKMSPGDTFLEKVKNLAHNCKSVINNTINWIRENLLDKLFGTEFGNALSGMFNSWCDIFKNIISFFKNVFTGNWKEAAADFVNIFISALNFFINKINAVLQFFAGSGSKLINALGKLLGKNWNLDSSGLKIPTIPKYTPKLATGAVLPGGSPMLAVVNDQPKGKTYVEGSVENIAAAFEKYFAGKNFGNGNSQDNRPIILQVDGKEVARANRSGENRLGTQTVYGGFANVY